ncbi:urea carboxylase [Shouchella sp. JSM 1781072]|uniref:urea carboxylase n=1 Tax=Shouchella sp. JSM 1781072 TaxID=3344581 RepID=UPI0035C1C941
MVQRVLIANRGTIATRISRTLKKMGIESVAVYTEADETSLHVQQADNAICIGDGPVQDSYTNTEKIIQVAKETHCDAIHPGYGFLSENDRFAETCKAEGLIFIGPTPSQLRQFGLKHEARKLAVEADVPLLPGTEVLTSVHEAIDLAEDIGYPVMLKSSAGGGGIGMRICQNQEDVRTNFERVSHLSSQHFNRADVFLEKYIETARHVEVQIFGSQSGDVVAVGERDCSIQRRNQKVIEEAPAPNLSHTIREKMHQAAVALAKTVGYQSAGTVEFLYDEKTESFYFLEMNTRLQVEHGVTEEVYGIDLVEWMVLESIGEWQVPPTLEVKGHSIQARIYAEDALLDFRPSTGTLDDVRLSSKTRNETWVEKGTTISSYYDPMLGKVIAKGETREEARLKLLEALEETRFYGLTSNVNYLENILRDEKFEKEHVYTTFLDSFQAEERALEVLDGGVQTSVQDFPSRLGHWDVGIPPSGPMDPLNFRIGNQLLGNKEEAAGLEMTLSGGSYRFRTSVAFVVTGADMKAELDGVPVKPYEVMEAQAQSILSFQQADLGMRTYLLIEGGLDVASLLGSKSTFSLGGFGGHGGRELRTGDVLRIAQVESAMEKQIYEQTPELTHEWEIGAILGPHSSSDYMDEAYIKQILETEFEVHFNSSRTGVRLIGPGPLWAREDGGEAGLHPSNIHDNAYAIGTLDLTGDTPILLGPDGPSLGGFVCPVTTIAAERWKIGQLKPGDKVRFQLVTFEEATSFYHKQETFIKEGLRLPALQENNKEWSGAYPILYEEDHSLPLHMTIRAAGDAYLLIEFGEMELNLRYRFQAHLLMEAIKDADEFHVFDLTPGIRSLQVHIDLSKTTVHEVTKRIIAIHADLPPLEEVEVPSRIVRLPLSWDDPSAQLAMERYEHNVRKDAPWCPDNIEFIRRINGLDEREDVYQTVFDANYLVMGLGDVYLGAPVATPTDPRHRLVTTKYNPARTWTPESAVGIGGAYMCIYGLEGPGGYQLFGRTLQVWNHKKPSKSFEEGKPWLLRFFDQINYYPVTEKELTAIRKKMELGQYEVEIEETTFKLADYLAFLEGIEEERKAYKDHQQAAFQQEREDWKEKGIAEYVTEAPSAEVDEEALLPDGVEPMKSSMPGSVWKVLVKPGQFVKEGEALVIEESMKMEFPQLATQSGVVHEVYVKPGDEVQAGTRIVSIRAESEVVSS